MDKIIELARKSGLSVAEHFYAVAGSTDNLQEFYTLARADYETKLSAVMPADFKDWHENNRSEWPDIAAWVITNLREQRADLEAEIFRLREHIIDQTKLDQEIAQLRKERQAFKDVTEYQKSENDQLLADLKVCQAKNRELWLELSEFHMHADTETKRAVRAALGEAK